MRVASSTPPETVLGGLSTDEFELLVLVVADSHNDAERLDGVEESVVELSWEAKKEVWESP